MNFKDIEIVKFELPNTITWGVEKNIRDGYIDSCVGERRRSKNKNRPTRRGTQYKKPIVRERSKENTLPKVKTFIGEAKRRITK